MGDKGSTGVCQCCLTSGPYDKMNLLSNADHENGPYVDMLTSCFSFNLSIPFMKLRDGKNYICNPCIKSLREAFAFKSRVEKSLKSMLVATEVPIKKEVTKKIIIPDEIEDTDWNLEYLEEYEDIVQMEPFSAKNDARIMDRSLAESALQCPYTETKWNRYLLNKICQTTIQCLVCLKKFPDNDKLYQHLNVHYPVFTCKYCGKSYANKKRIDAHIGFHMMGKFPCKHCEEVFNVKPKLTYHHKTHKKKARLTCQFCSVYFDDYRHKAKHELFKHNYPKEPFTCKECGATFNLAGSLSLHTRRVHLKERTKVCKICGKKFFRMNGLKLHLVVHETERTYKCERCLKTYPRPETLKNHMKIHTNERMFKCKICNGRSFIQKCSLKIHMKTHQKDLNHFEELREKDNKTGLVYVYMDYKKQLT